MLRHLLFFLPACWAAVQIDLSQQKTEVEFLAVGKPSLVKIHGTGAKLSGSLELDKDRIKGKVRVSLEEFTTGIALRDRHMMERYLETAKFPQATFEVEKADLPEDFLSAKKTYSGVPIQGKLSLHGVEKSVTALADVDTSLGSPYVSTEFRIRLSDYGIEIPSYLGVKVADEVTVKARMNLNMANP